MANTKRNSKPVEPEETNLSFTADYNATKDFYLNTVMSDGAYQCNLMLTQTKKESSNSGIFLILEKFQELAAVAANIANQRGNDEIPVISLRTILHQLEEEYPDDPDVDIQFVLARKVRIHPLVKSSTKKENFFLQGFINAIRKEEEELQEKKKKIQELQKQNFESANSETQEIPF